MKPNEEIQVLKRAFSILEYIAENPCQPHRISELSEISGLNKNTVSKIVRTLNQFGYLENIGRKSGYVLGQGIYGLSRNRRQDANILRRIATPWLIKFEQEFNEYICISVLLSTKRHIVTLQHGSNETEYPLMAAKIESPYETVSGRVLLSGLSRAQQKNWLKKNGFPGESWNNIRTEEAFLNELEKISRAEYLQSKRENLVCIAVPVRQYDGKIFASLGCYVELSRYNETLKTRIVAAMKETAAHIAQEY